MARKLLKDIDLETLYAMRRDEEMSNADIASALGVSYGTVLSLIGPQPKNVRRKPRISAVPAPAPVEEEAPLRVWSWKAGASSLPAALANTWWISKMAAWILRIYVGSICRFPRISLTT